MIAPHDLDQVLAALREAVVDDEVPPAAPGDPLGEALHLVARLAARPTVQAHEALRHREHFLDSILEQLPYMVFVKDAANLRFVRFNAAGERLLGRRREELLGRSDRDFFPAAEAEFFTAKDRVVLESGMVLDIPEEPIHTASGLRWLHTRKIPLLDAAGKPSYLLGISEDITDVRRAREELAQATLELATANDGLSAAQRDLATSEARLKVLLDHLPGVLFTTDTELRLTSCAGAHAADLGLGSDTAGMTLTDHPLGAAVPPHALREVAGGVPWVGEWRAANHLYEVRLQRMESSQDGLAGVVLDITDRHRAEAERLQARIQRAQKLESLGLLAGGIAHDFNNLLASILGNLTLARGKLTDDHAAQPALDRMERSTERAADLTRQLLAYSGKGRFVVGPVDLREVVGELADLLRVSVTRKASLILDFPDALPKVEADVAQVRQLVMNLLTNASDAVDAADDRAQPALIRLGLAIQRADREWLDSAWMHDDLADGLYVSLEVSDTGCGMDASTMAQMFDPFFTTKEHGHGLGLAATLGIVRGHRGAIRVYSEPGRGTTIKVLLPALPGDETGEGLPETAPVPSQGTVLVVDDDPGLRELAEAVLTDAGYHVLLARDGVEAVELFRAHKDRIVAVLLDMTMPRMNGEQTFRELRKLQAGVRVLLSSGYNEQDATSRFAGKGLAGFLQKPYRARDLVERIGALVELNPAAVGR